MPTKKDQVIIFAELLNKDFLNYNTNQQPMIFSKLELSLLKDAYDFYKYYKMPDCSPCERLTKSSYLHYLYMIYNKYTYLTLWKPMKQKKFYQILFKNI